MKAAKIAALQIRPSCFIILWSLDVSHSSFSLMLELRNISKSFPGVCALDDVSLSFRPGEIHGLMGENGAGKSTAIKIMTGIYQPDAGEVRFNGEPVTLADYRDSLARGIGIVHQELHVIPDASVAENIMIDKLITRGFGVID